MFVCAITESKRNIYKESQHYHIYICASVCVFVRTDGRIGAGTLISFEFIKASAFSFISTEFTYTCRWRRRGEERNWVRTHTQTHFAQFFSKIKIINEIIPSAPTSHCLWFVECARESVRPRAPARSFIRVFTHLHLPASRFPCSIFHSMPIPIHAHKSSY